MVFSASFYYALNNPDIQDGYYYFKRQIQLTGITSLYTLQYRMTNMQLILIISISLLIAVLVIGREINERRDG